MLGASHNEGDNKKYMKTWETKEGIEIPYKQLGDSHLLNILKWIEKRADNGVLVVMGGGSSPEDYWYEEYEISGDEVFERYDYKGLQKEAKKRGII